MSNIKAEPVAWANSSSLAIAAVGRERGGPYDQHTWSEARTAYHTVPLYLHPAPTPPEQADAIRAAVLAERERCAKVCDLHSRLTWNDDRKAQSRVLAAEIRKEPT